MLGNCKWIKVLYEKGISVKVLMFFNLIFFDILLSDVFVYVNIDWLLNKYDICLFE